MVVTGTRSFLVFGNVTDHQEWISSEDANYPFSAVETLLGVLAACGTYCRLIFYSHAEVILVISTGTLQIVAEAFGTEIEKSCNNQEGPSRTLRWINIKTQYYSIKQLATLINRVYGLTMTLLLSEVILYYSVSFGSIFIKKSFPDLGEILPVLCYWAVTIAILWMSGNVSSQVVCAKAIYLSSLSVAGFIISILAIIKHISC